MKAMKIISSTKTSQTHFHYIHMYKGEIKYKRQTKKALLAPCYNLVEHVMIKSTKVLGKKETWTKDDSFKGGIKKIRKIE
jgi:hypothetical protein